MKIWDVILSATLLFIGVYLPLIIGTRDIILFIHVSGNRRILYGLCSIVLAGDIIVNLLC